MQNYSQSALKILGKPKLKWNPLQLTQNKTSLIFTSRLLKEGGGKEGVLQESLFR